MNFMPCSSTKGYCYIEEFCCLLMSYLVVPNDNFFAPSSINEGNASFHPELEHNSVFIHKRNVTANFK